MNSMNDERFFDLAMKVIARQSSDAERAELEAMFARQPELKAEFDRLQAEVRVAKEALPLMNATEATAGELPGYARERLQTKVRQTMGRPASTEKEPDRSLAWGWRVWLGLASAVAALVIVLLTVSGPRPGIQIQLAMLDLAGESRGGTNDAVTAMQETWKGARVETFSETTRLAAWEGSWPRAGKENAVKLVYDRAAGELRVLGFSRSGRFTNSFTVNSDLKTALAKAKAYVEQQVAK